MSRQLTSPRYDSWLVADVPAAREITLYLKYIKGVLCVDADVSFSGGSVGDSGRSAACAGARPLQHWKPVALVAKAVVVRALCMHNAMHMPLLDLCCLLHNCLSLE